MWDFQSMTEFQVVIFFHINVLLFSNYEWWTALLKSVKGFTFLCIFSLLIAENNNDHNKWVH